MREHHGRDEPGQLRRIHGEQHHLEHHAVAAGAVELSDAIVRWWVLDDDHRARRREAALWASTGHAAAVFDDELYDVLPPTRGGYGRLQDFGIRFGYERVVLHIEPQAEAGRLECNTARTLLLLDHEPLPWARWGEEFAAAMPEEILRLQERAAGADCVPRQEAIRSRVSAILPLYRLSRYRPTSRQPDRPTEPAATRPADDRPAHPRAEAPSTGQPAAEPACASAQREHAHEPRGEPGAERTTATSDGAARPRSSICPTSRGSQRATQPGRRATSKTRPPATTPRRHELTINADFRAITDLIAHWRGRYRGVPGARTRDRGAGPRMVRTDPGRGRARRPQLALERGAARRAARRRARSPPPCCHDSCCTPRSRSDSAQKLGTPTPMAETATPRPTSWHRPAGAMPDTPS